MISINYVEISFPQKSVVKSMKYDDTYSFDPFLIEIKASTVVTTQISVIQPLDPHISKSH